MSTDRPNVLLIMTDQHRHDLMSCAGDSVVPTPNIDRIARSGVRFTNAYSTYPVCVAARMAMLTGLGSMPTRPVSSTIRTTSTGATARWPTTLPIKGISPG